MSPSPILSPSDEEEERLLTQPDAEADKAEAIDSDEEEERLLTQPPDAEADKAEAIDLTVESEAPNTKRSGPSKRKVITITPGSKTPNKKKQRSDISDADLDAQLKQVSTFNANDSLLHAATEDNESKKAIKYFSMPVLGNKSSKWWEGFEQLVPSKHPKLFTEYVLCVSCLKSANPESGLVKIGICQSTSNHRAHKKFNHPEEYEAITIIGNLKTPQSVIPTTSIKNMPGFSVCHRPW